MTEYWVSQGNKWCDFCKIYIANNSLSIRTHELGTRHKDNVARRLAAMQKESKAKDKEQKEAIKAMQQIEAKAKQSYKNDLATFEKSMETCSDSQQSSDAAVDEWLLDPAMGYHFNKASGCYYDTGTNLYYTNNGEWVTQEVALSSGKITKPYRGSSALSLRSASGDQSASNNKGGPAPGRVVEKSLNPQRPIKGVPSSIAVGKRKRGDEKPKVVSKEEEAALRAREAARKRMEEREKPLMGLYKSY